ncbi:hypothetical protein [Paraliobacillus sp. X-1268]|uniref:hypothetical protein n=1 Tax=Paraliobacillus sp. X-1268 TaxID=2213193 RepID=UPI000E3B5CB8|nr:hypothetical protein [Paraliobacillus sp. X-1268]
MIKNLEQNNEITVIKNAHKPSLVMLIVLTLISIGPSGNLFLEITDGDYSRVFLLSLMSLPLLIFIGVIWTRYFYQMGKYKQELEDYMRDPSDYEW